MSDESGFQGADQLRVVESRPPWRYELTVDTSSTPPRPVRLCVSVDPEHDDGSALGVEAVRAAPMRALSAAAVRAASESTRTTHALPLDAVPSPSGDDVTLQEALALARALPSRLSDPDHYATLALAYTKAVQLGVRDPIATLARELGLSRNTVSGRIRRAREQGLLSGKPHAPAYRLSGNSRELIDEVFARVAATLESQQRLTPSRASALTPPGTLKGDDHPRDDR